MKTLKRNPSKEDIRSAYRSVIWIYDFWSRMTEQKAMDLGIKWAEIEDGQQIIDIGCGTGRLLGQIVNQNPHGSNTGLDLSDKMLARAEKRLSQFKGNYRLIYEDFLIADPEAHNYDTIFNYYMAGQSQEIKRLTLL